MGMAQYEMSIIFDSDSEESAVEAVDALGAAFNEHLTGWAANIQPLDLNWSRRGYSDPDALRAIDVNHWDESPKERDTA